jgi:hypothetical protein
VWLSNRRTELWGQALAVGDLPPVSYPNGASGTQGPPQSGQGWAKPLAFVRRCLRGPLPTPSLFLPLAPIRRLQRALRRAGPQGGEGLLEPLALLLHQTLGTLQPEGAAVGEQPAAQRWIAIEHPGRQCHLHPVGMARVRCGGQHRPGFGAAPAVAGQGLAQADCLGWIAIQLAADGFGQRLPLPFRQPSTPR